MVDRNLGERVVVLGATAGVGAGLIVLATGLWAVLGVCLLAKVAAEPLFCD